MCHVRERGGIISHVAATINKPARGGGGGEDIKKVVPIYIINGKLIITLGIGRANSILYAASCVCVCVKLLSLIYQPTIPTIFILNYIRE